MAGDQRPRWFFVFDHRWPEYAAVSRVADGGDETAGWPGGSPFQDGGNAADRRPPLRPVRESVRRRHLSGRTSVPCRVPAGSISEVHLPGGAHRNPETRIYGPRREYGCD